MPILDPSTIIALQNQSFNDENNRYSKQFFIHYLKTASRNLYQNPQTIEASIQFKKDLKSSIDFLNEEFGCNFQKDSNLDNYSISDYYKYLYNHINPIHKKKIFKNPKGSYLSLCSTLKMDLFKPFVDYPKGHSWFFTSYPVAILCINVDELQVGFDKLIKLFNLEIDLMLASGFTVVLNLFLSLKKNKKNMRLINFMIETHPFSEIHLIVNDINSSHDIDDLFKAILDIYDNIKGYFYLYSEFIKENCPNFKLLKQKPKFKYIFASYSPNKVFKELEVYKIRPFPFCKTGFNEDKICVKICQAPLYKTENDDDDCISNEIAVLTEGYIKAADFLNFTNTRVKIIFNDLTKNNRHFQRYINFEDVHVLKPDLYVKETFYFVKIDQDTLKIINNIINSILDKNSTGEDFKKEKIFSLFKEKKIQKGLTYVYNAYSINCLKSSRYFELHENQLLTAIEACRACIFKEKRTNKGVIYQVETGEGKSCIIQVIAAVLALMKITVHVTSSNIILANRDYYNSYNFFNMLGLSSAVLLHYNELPYVSFNKLSNDDTFFDINFYPRKFFSSKLFKNSSNMNFSVCGINNDNEITKDKANIIFSTFINFECLYLRMMEMCPGYIADYFNKCSLLIDEADSILIDELANGTILSRTIKTNANEVLKYIYSSQREDLPVENVLRYVKENWPECTDIKLDDIKSMYEEIELVNKEEFIDGKKYSIEDIEIEDETNILDAIKKAYETGKIKTKKAASKLFSNLFTKRKDKKKKDKKKKSNEKEEAKNAKEKKKIKVIKTVIPFDYDHKGILEPNKEFSGFVQQFIAIKEIFNNYKENQNMNIKDISMNYLFVSHPIFVNMYGGAIGLTGTVGKKYEKKIFMDQYNLKTMKIPRNKANLRVDHPILLCQDIKERNNKIAEEVVFFHQNDFPVLVIFQDLNEILDVFYILVSKGIKNINIFDGKDEKVKPDLIAGLKGAVSLGTNVCGRGTDIKNPIKPLHVIVSYFTSNSRVMNQAFGRTARQGQEGSVHIICVKNQFLLPTFEYNKTDVDDAINDFKCKNEIQINFIESFRAKRKWIFYNSITSQKIPSDLISIMREVKINVNRIKVINFMFPICMSIKSFLTIQAQKIFSLYNCPNCKYTWMLFQKYIREMILESWSLLIDKSMKKYEKKTRTITYSVYLKNKVEKLTNLLKEYLPDYSDSKQYEIIPTFMHIFLKVVSKYQLKVMCIYPEILTRIFRQTGINRFSSFTIGFKPYSLVDESGARINTVDGTDQDQHYISDPELKYMQKQPSGRSLIISITEKIDGIFNWICSKINEIIGSYIGLKFFLRRTLGGCEFGICLDLDLEYLINKNEKDYTCLVDKDPLLMFTICVKSVAPLLAGILIIGLVYLASVSKSIAEWILAFPEKITKALIKKTLIEVSSIILDSQIERLCNVVCNFLIKILDKQIKKLQNFNPEISEVFKVLMKIINPKDFSFSGDKIQEIFENKANIKMNTNFGNMFIKDNIPFVHFVKIGFLLMLCFASFMLNFHFHHHALKYNEAKEAKEYDENQDPEKALNHNQKVIDEKSIGKPEYIDFNTT